MVPRVRCSIILSNNQILLYLYHGERVEETSIINRLNEGRYRGPLILGGIWGEDSLETSLFTWNSFALHFNNSLQEPIPISQILVPVPPLLLHFLFLEFLKCKN